jgi:hypothetical protein
MPDAVPALLGRGWALLLLLVHEAVVRAVARRICRQRIERTTVPREWVAWGCDDDGGALEVQELQI